MHCLGQFCRANGSVRENRYNWVGRQLVQSDIHVRVPLTKTQQLNTVSTHIQQSYITPQVKVLPVCQCLVTGVGPYVVYDTYYKDAQGVEVVAQQHKFSMIWIFFLCLFCTEERKGRQERGEKNL